MTAVLMHVCLGTRANFFLTDATGLQATKRQIAGYYLFLNIFTLGYWLTIALTLLPKCESTTCLISCHVSTSFEEDINIGIKFVHLRVMAAPEFTPPE